MSEGPPTEPGGGRRAEAVRRTLARIEATLRELALVALAQWEATGVASPALHRPIAGLQRPSWGTWNGLVQALRKARRDTLRSGSPAEREGVESAALLGELLSVLGTRLPPPVAESLAPLCKLARRRAGKLVHADLLTLPIPVRNQIAHELPTDAAWWTDVAEALAPLTAYLDGANPLAARLAQAATPAPWFRDGDRAWTFAGVERDFAVVYVGPGGRRAVDDAASRPLLLALQQLLGRADVQAKDFRRLLAKLAPEEIRGVLLGDYLVGRPVGRGGFATVHVGRQLSTGQKVAVKILHDGMPEETRERFQREAAYLSRFTHPHIVRVLGYGESTWSAPRDVDLRGEAWFAEFARSAAVRAYIALEWIDGADLSDRFRPGEAAAAQHELTRWFHDAATALSAVHASGLVHRDVKPANLMVADDGRVRLMDFGIARTQQEDRTLRTATGHAIGTPAYMSPEQIRAADGDTGVGPASDVYSLCAAFYELFTGRRLFEHDVASVDTTRSRKLKGDLPRRPRAVRSELPWEIDTILLGGLQPDVADRYASADALATDLAHALANEPIAYRRPSWTRRVVLAYRRNPVVSNLIVMFVLLAITGATQYIVSLASERDRTRLQAAFAGAGEARARYHEREAVDALERVLRLRAAREYEELVGRVRHLPPVRPASIPEFDAWITEAEGLLGGLADFRAQLAELEQRAVPYTDAQRRSDHREVYARIDELHVALATTRKRIGDAVGKHDAASKLTREVGIDLLAAFERELGDLAQQVRVRGSWSFDDPNEAWVRSLLAFIVQALEGLEHPTDGPLTRVRSWRAAADAMRAREESAAPAWRAAVERIADPTRSPRYDGLRIPPQSGLVPLGPDPASGLEEFFVLESGREVVRGADGLLGASDEMGIVLVLIPGGSFLMGSQGDDPAAPNYVAEPLIKETPVHEVTLSPYFLGKYEVTQGQWAQITGGAQPAAFTVGIRISGRVTTWRHPVEHVSWSEARRPLERWNLRLPSEAQWEHACRAGTRSLWWTGDLVLSLQGAANLADRTYQLWAGEGDGQVTPLLDDGYHAHAPVGTYRANPFGLHDMHGNVSEWVADGFLLYADAPRTDPVNPTGLPWRVTRGGSWWHGPRQARTSFRADEDKASLDDTIGLRAGRALTR